MNKRQVKTSPWSAQIAIIGGGVMGAMTALVAAHSGLSVLWFGPKESGRADGADHRNYALAPSTVGLLRRLGVWPSLESNSCTVCRMEVFSGSARIDLSATDAGSDFLSVMVLHEDLLAALESAIRFQPRIERKTVKPDAIEFLKDHVRLALDGHIFTAQLAVGADGARSWLRQQAKIMWGQKDYGQKAYVTAFESSQAHGQVAAQWFLPQGILALLPLAKPHQLSMVLSTSQNIIAKTEEDRTSLSRQIESASGHRFGSLEMLGGLTAAPLKMLVTEAQSSLRTVLLGDAAHTVHPLAGYGLNLGVEDLLALEAIWLESPDDVGAQSAIQNYEKRRHHRVRRVQFGLDSLQRLVGDGHPSVQGLREMGMRFISRVGPLRQLLIRQAISPQ